MKNKMKCFVLVSSLMLMSGCELVELSHLNTEQSVTEAAVIKRLDDIRDEGHLINPNILSTRTTLRSSVESIPYLTVGDAVTIHSQNNEIGTVSLDKVEVITNQKGYEGKSIVLHFTETNLTNQPLSLGEGELDLLNVSHLFFNQLYLDAFSKTDVDYFDSLPTYEGESLCQTPMLLKPNQSRQCYSVYSYGGNGEYIVSLATEIMMADRWHLDEWRSYQFELK